MDKNNNINEIFINYYVDWKTSNWLKDLFDQNGLDINDIELVFGGSPNKQVTPERAPSLTNNQNGI